MNKKTPYTIDFMLKIKKVNPNWEFKGENKRIYDEFIESQQEESLIDTLNEITEEKPKKKKSKKVKQVVEITNTESMDYAIENEIDEESV